MRITKNKTTFVPKNWGHELWISNNELYCGKVLFFIKGGFCSAHYHKDKTETFYLFSGKVEIRFSDNLEELEKYINTYGTKNVLDQMEKEILEPGDTFHIPPGRIHMMIGLLNSELLEVSTHHEESDSYRLFRL